MAVKDDGRMLYIKGDYFVRQDKENGRFFVNDVDGIAPGQDMEHVGDDYATLDQAKQMADFWAADGHWMDRPDMKIGMK